MFTQPIFKGIAAIDIKGMKQENINAYCEICECHVKKKYWRKHVKTNKHNENTNGGQEGEEVEKRRCGQCGCSKELEMFNEKDATCNVCLG